MRLLLKDARDQNFQIVRRIDIFWEGKRAILDFFICIFDILRFKRRTSINQSIDNYTKAPNINFIAVPF